jgi:hypothetical protein
VLSKSQHKFKFVIPCSRNFHVLFFCREVQAKHIKISHGQKDPLQNQIVIGYREFLKGPNLKSCNCRNQPKNNGSHVENGNVRRSFFFYHVFRYIPTHELGSLCAEPELPTNVHRIPCFQFENSWLTNIHTQTHMQVNCIYIHTHTYIIYNSTQEGLSNKCSMLKCKIYKCIQQLITLTRKFPADYWNLCFL